MKANFLNHDIPLMEGYVRKEFLYDNQKHHGEFLPCVAFGLASIEGRALSFHIMTHQGAQFARVPLHSLCWKIDAPTTTLERIQLWDCFSYYVSVHEYGYLSELRCRVYLKDKSLEWGTYCFTIDWAGSDFSENAGDTGHKCAHVIALDDGNFAAQPNNRIFWSEPSFVVQPFADTDRPDFITQSQVFKAETESKWCSSPTSEYFYSPVEQTDRNVPKE